jgi:hypothetical protein
LLDHTIAEARREGAKLLRVETSDDAEEAPAQGLYESRGLTITEVQPTNRGYSKIFRELLLSPAPDAVGDGTPGVFNAEGVDSP